MDKIIAMYDIRGIQNYIYKTAKLSDAIGASSIVETIIEKTLEEAVDTYEGGTLSKDISWKDENGPLSYKETDADVQVLYIGGGNACVCYKNAEVCKTVNRKMSKLVLDKTYSLQLAIATTEKSENYANDYKKVMSNLIQVKDRMVTSMPLGALPIMDVEVKTGLPKCAVSKASDPKYQGVSRETLLKREQENRDRRGIDKRKKLLDSYVEEKGIDSTLGIVHIDGNNMGIRIRELIQEKESYEEAVNLIRKISYRIDDSYKKAFEKMRDKFNGLSADEEIVLKILTAGDDITYALTSYLISLLAALNLGSSIRLFLLNSDAVVFLSASRTAIPLRLFMHLKTILS